MTLSLKSKFVFLGLLAATATITAAVENYITDKASEAFSDQEQLATEVIQRHMNGDMMHDGIRGNVYSALYGAKIGESDMVVESQSTIQTMVEEFAVQPPFMCPV